MKYFFISLLLVSLLYAHERPKIALVLSGGGARGGAHVGVLKELEKYHVPIDMIVGTSVGSLVGGLYASGTSPDAIEKILVSTDWKRYIRTDYNRQDIPMRKKDLDFTYQGRLGLGINVKNELVVPTGVLKRQPMLLKFMELTQNIQDVNNFDNLDIPFRAVATNISNGDAVVLKSGSLAKAIYASSSIPGGFEPIRINGINLVDGGVSKNIPISVARDMGADIIIVVDVSENFDKNLDVNSYFVVMGQLINILMRKNANESLATLSDKDILLTPDLNGFSGLDADKYAQIIKCGVDVAQANHKKLQTLSLDDASYSIWKEQHKILHQYNAPIIDAIKIENLTYLSNKSIRKRLSQQVGKKLDIKRLREDLLHLYNMMLFDSVDYELKEENKQTILVIKTTPNWDSNGEIRFAFGIEDDFSGHSAYSLKMGYTMFGLNSYGGEWKNDFEIGRYKKAATEIFQPLDAMQRYYLRPSLSYKSVTDLFSIGTLANQELDTSRVGGSFVVGAHVTTNYEFEVGFSAFKDNVRVDALSIDENYNARPLCVLINVDDLDNVNFPKIGMKSQLKWTKEMHSLGSDYDYEQLYFDLEKPFTFYSNNLTLYAKFGTTYLKKDKNINRLSGKYTLGGLFNLSGYTPYSFYGDNVALAVVKYTYELKDGGFFGTLNAPLYAGFSLETGNAWSDGAKMDMANLKESATIYLAADTFLGPFYLAYGTSIDGKQSAYLYLGEKF